MIGYSMASKAYKLWDMESRKVIVARSVKFDEQHSSSAEVVEDDEPSSSETEDVPTILDPLDTKTPIDTSPEEPPIPISETAV